MAFNLPPPPTSNDPKDPSFRDWFYKLQKAFTTLGSFLYTNLDFTGSNLTSILTRNHADLQNLDTASYTHLTATNATDLTDGGATTLHKHDHAAQDNLNSASYTHLTATQATDLTDGGETVLHKHAAADINMPVVGSPAGGSTLKRDFNTRGSSGVIDGTQTYVTMASATTIDVAAGEGYIRTTNDQQGDLVFITWAASLGITIPTPAAGQETTRFVGIEYNSGSPQVTVRTTFNWNWYDDFPLARVSYDGVTLRTLNTYAHAEDTANLTRKYLRLNFPFNREEAPEGSGGLVLGETGTRNLTMTAGNLWHGFNKYELSMQDTSASDAFDTHYRRAGGGFNTTHTQTQWPNTQYDDGSGTLVTMTNNRYACLWVFVDAADNEMDIVYGRDQYVTVAQAEEEGIPSTPDHLTYHGRLIGRIIFQKSAATATAIESAWENVFSAASVNNHNQLSGLQGGTSGEYYHLTAAELAAVTALGSGVKVYEPAMSGTFFSNVTYTSGEPKSP